MSVPKIIWVLWLQGFENAPPLVQTCVTSWKRHNPDWSVRQLSQDTLRDYLDAKFCDDVLSSGFPFKKMANIIRLALIAQHGGVWVDADCFCTQPLDSWIHTAAHSGFFAFRFVDSDQWLLDETVPQQQRLLARTRDRVMANWFLAGAPGNKIARDFSDAHFDLLKTAKPENRSLSGIFRKPIMKALQRNAFLGSIMGGPNFVSKMGKFPFYIFHYHFAYMLRTNSEFRAAWGRVQTLEASTPLSFSKTLGLPVDQNFKDAMIGGSAPVYKFHSRRTKPLQTGAQTRYDWLQDYFK